MILFLAGEDRLHFEAGKTVALQVLHENIGWFDPVMLEWIGPDDEFDDGNLPYFKLKNAMRRAKNLGLSTLGHFGGRAGLPEARMFRAQLQIWKRLALELRKAGRDVVGGIILRDVDGDPRRCDGARQARSSGTSVPVALGFCNPEAEAWYLCMFDARTDAESKRIAELTETLGFSATTQTHRLSSTSGGERDAKNVLSKLSGRDSEREHLCLERRTTDELRARGKAVGLAAFISEIESNIVTAFRSSGRSSD